MELDALGNPGLVMIAIGDRIYNGKSTERHARKGVLFRPTKAERQWLYDYARANDRTVNDVLCEALREYRKARIQK